MANPNLANVSNIYAKNYTIVKGLASNGSVPSSQVGTFNLISNPSNSGKVFKINLINVSAVSNTFTTPSGSSRTYLTDPATVLAPKYSILINSGGYDYYVINDKLIENGVDSGLTKEKSLYLTEGQTLKFFSSTNNAYYNSTQTASFYSAVYYYEHLTWGLAFIVSYEELS
jgi:hypothetical protein